MKTDYSQRLRISTGPSNEELYDHDGMTVLRGYARVVIGERGPYIEADLEHFAETPRDVPGEKWRKTSPSAYYEWQETSGGIKVYYQKRVVDYAGYLVGKYYIDPFQLYKSDGSRVIDPLRKK